RVLVLRVRLAFGTALSKLVSVELRQLRYFVAVAEEGSISRAAKNIFLTQSALSRQIKALEETLGQCLLERQAHSVRLTRAGEVLLPEARHLLQQAEQLFQRARSAGRYRLRVGYGPSLAAGMLPAVVENYTRTHPDAHVELFDLSTSEMLTGLENGRLDVAVTVSQEHEVRGMTWTPLVHAPWQLAVSRRHAFAGKGRLSPAEIANEPLLAFCRRDYPEYWHIISSWLQEHGQNLRIKGEYDGVDSLMAAVESGLGVAVVATRNGRLVPEKVVLKTLSPAPPPLCVGACHRIDRADDEALAVFIGQLGKTAQEFV
ncbi:MAG TPA: LysR family transcriptional regulator, partial [Verrucomicrobiales bacterium]|nr:LysR family transcriptional regulator [Verrucomicrobiales bacterium]